MTCIVAYIDGAGCAWMGGDRCVSNNSFIDLVGEPKVRRIGPMLVGGSGNAAVISDVLWADWPEAPEGGEPMRWLTQELAPWFRCRMRSEGWLVPGEGDLPGCRTSFVLTWRGRIFRIGGSGGIMPVAGRHYVDGPVQSEGVLFALARSGFSGSPLERVQMALEAAATFAEGVREPFDIICDGEASEASPSPSPLRAGPAPRGEGQRPPPPGLAYRERAPKSVAHILGLLAGASEVWVADKDWPDGVTASMAQCRALWAAGCVVRRSLTDEGWRIAKAAEDERA